MRHTSTKANEPKSAGRKSQGGGGSKTKQGAGGTSTPLSPLSDLEFDLISVMYQKAKALDAYSKYLGDTGGSDDVRECLETIRNDDARHIRMLKECFAEVFSAIESQGGGDADEIHA
jgi:hypothetical protein